MTLPESPTAYVDEIIPDDWNEAKDVLKNRITKDAYAINSKEIAEYAATELRTGQKFFTVTGDVQDSYETYRMLVNFGTLPNNTTATAAHGITINDNTIFTRIYGAATNPVSPYSYIPIPYVDTAGNNIKLTVTGTNVEITTTANYSAYIQCYVILEYIRG